MSVTIKINCAVCGADVEYDGKMTCCPHCMLDFESDEITEWKKRLSAQPREQTSQHGAKESPRGVAPPEASGVQPETPKAGAMPKGGMMPKAQPIPPSAPNPAVSLESQEKKDEPSGTVFEWRGMRFYPGQEKDALLLILRNGLIDEIVDEHNAVTDRARKLLEKIGKRAPSMPMYSRVRKFFEIMYGTVFPDEQVPLYVTEARTGLPMANDRAQFIDRLECNFYSGAVLEFNRERMTLKELTDSGVTGAYLGVPEGIDGLRRLFKTEGKRLSIDESCNCANLGGDEDICRRDDLMFARYEYYLISDLNPCDGYDGEARFDREFLSIYGGYAGGGNAEKYMNAYFYLLSVAFERTGECEVFGETYNAAQFLAALKSSAETAAEENDYDKFVLMRQLLKRRVFGVYSSDYERIIAGEPTVESALFEAYYGLTKEKKLLYYEGRYLSAQSVARKTGERGNVGNLLTDNGKASFMSAVGRCVKVDVARIRSQIESGIKNILEELR